MMFQLKGNSLQHMDVTVVYVKIHCLQDCFAVIDLFSYYYFPPNICFVLRDRSEWLSASPP
jgi:hypothetical protein